MKLPRGVPLLLPYIGALVFVSVTIAGLRYVSRLTVLRRTRRAERVQAQRLAAAQRE